jgi:uncharacterized membrane protein
VSTEPTPESEPPRPADGRTRTVMAAVMIPMIVATGIALLVLWPDPVARPDAADGVPRHTGQVTAVRIETCPAGQPDEQTPSGLAITRCGSVDVRVDDGPDAGQIVTTQVPGGPGAPVVDIGDNVVMLVFADPTNPTSSRYSIIDHQRGQTLIILTLVFAVGIIAFGRWRGLAALVGLAVSFAVLLLFIVPAIMNGASPLLVAIVGAAAIMFTVLYLTHGISIRTSVAVLGTLLSLILTGLGATVTAAAAHLSGFGGEEATTLAIFYRDVDLHGLLLAGIIIGSLGVLDDVTVTQAATVAELAAANPAMSRIQLYRAATRVGRAHIASVVNTIVLAYAGAALPLLLLIVAGGSGVGQTLTSQFLAQEIVRSAVGTLGLIAAVPITTALAAIVTTGRQQPDPTEPTAMQTRPRPRPPADPDGAALAADRRTIAAPWADQP